MTVEKLDDTLHSWSRLWEDTRGVGKLTEGGNDKSEGGVVRGNNFAGEGFMLEV